MFSLSGSKRRVFLPFLSTSVIFLSVWIGVSVVQKQEIHKEIQAQEIIEINYQTSTEDFANPERGFMKQSWIWPDQAFEPNKIRAKEPSDSVVWVYFRLENYRDPRDGKGVLLNDYQCQPIDSAGLSRISQTFQTAREKGLKLVYRFIYNWGPGSTSDPNQANPDVPIECVRLHISQLKQIIIDNIDVTVALQAGFVGHWGEWHSSKYLNKLAYRNEIVDTLVSILPDERMLLLRYPRYKEIFFKGPLTQSEAFLGTDRSRVGHHNDCFLRDKDDTTYRSKTAQTCYIEQGQKVCEPQQISNFCDSQDAIACWKDFVAQEGQFTPIGGETCQYNPPRTDCPNAQAELEMLHWSFINNGYRPEVLDSWKAQGCWDTIRRRLGYRFVLSKLNVTRQVAPGGNMAFRLELRNEGYASAFNSRPFYLVLREKTTGFQQEIALTSVDPRRWRPGQITVLDLKVPIPANFPQGTYNLYLWLPDAAQSLRNRPEYAIRLANQNVWQPSTGFNLIFDNLTISGTPVTPTQAPTKVPTPSETPSLPGDINGDGTINILDYQLLTNNFGATNCGNTADIDGDCDVDIFDYNTLVSNFGKKV